MSNSKHWMYQLQGERIQYEERLPNLDYETDDDHKLCQIQQLNC